MNKEELLANRQHRTTEGTIFEVAFLVMALLSWGFIAWLIAHAPQVVPTHYDLTGHANSYGTPLTILFPCIMLTVVGACLLAGAYFPSTIHMPFPIRTPRQIALAVRTTRIMALLIMVLNVAVAADMLQEAMGLSLPPTLLIMAVVALILVFTLVSSILIYRAR